MKMFVRCSGVFLLLLLVGAGVAIFLLLGERSRGDESKIETRQSTQVTGSPHAYVYFTLKNDQGFVLARAPKGASGQPIGAPQELAVIGGGFGLVETDSVVAIQLSPDQVYLAIDGNRDHGEEVWVYDTRSMAVRLLPSGVSGNFLHWQARGNGHTFLYRPVLPLGPDAPRDWNSGLWLVDAATGAHKNIALGSPSLTSANLVDAASSPDGESIIYSTTAGLGMGSETWLTNSDGSNRRQILRTEKDAQAITGFFAWSPDGKNIAFENLSDNAMPYLSAGLWVMNNQGAQPYRLADVDSGHGFAFSWSPDSRKIAYIAPSNTRPQTVNVQEQVLECAIGVADVHSKRAWLVASPQQTGMQMNIHPTWSADSASITFAALNPPNRILGGAPRYWLARVAGPQEAPNVRQLTAAIPHVIAIGD